MNNHRKVSIQILAIVTLMFAFSSLSFAADILEIRKNIATPLDDADKETAKKLFSSGKKEFSAGRYLRAVIHFEETYEITALPEILYNIGRCYEELKRSEKAVDYYEMYLRLDTETDDTTDVKERIQHLSDKEPQTQTNDTNTTIPGVKLCAQMGGSRILKGEEGWKNRVYVPLDLIVHFPINDWLSISGLFSYGTYMEGQRSFRPSDPRSQLGFGVGLMAAKHIKGRFSFVGRLNFLPTFVRRDRHKTAIWANLQGTIGTEAHIHKSWSAIFEIAGGYGPVVIPSRNVIDSTWHDPVLSVVDVGARLGIIYTF